jgi:O-antigen ligase
MSATTSPHGTRRTRPLAGRARATTPWLGLLAAGYVVLGDAAAGIDLGFCSLNGGFTAIIALAMGITLFRLARITRDRWRYSGGGPGPDAGTGTRTGPGLSLRAAAAWPGTAHLLFLAWALLALPRGGSPQIAVQQLSVYLIFIASVILAAWGPARPDPEQLLRWMAGAAWAVAAIYAVTLLIVGLNANLIYSARGFALISVVLLPVSLARAGRGRGTVRNVQPYVLLTLVVLSLSRTALAVLAVQLIAWWLSGQRGRGVLLRAAGALTAAAGVGYLLLFRFGPLHDRFFVGDLHRIPGSTPQAGAADGSWLTRLPSINLQGRSHLWATLWDSGREHLWAGQGLGTATQVIQAEYPLLVHPHNDYLRLLLDTGVIGLGLWLLGAAVIAYRLLRGVRRASAPRTASAAWAASAALLGIAVTMITDNSLVYSFVMLPLGVLVGAGLREAHASGTATAGASPDPADEPARDPRDDDTTGPPGTPATRFPTSPSGAGTR